MASHFFLRLLFHEYIKDKCLHVKHELQKEGRFSFLRIMQVIDKLVYVLFRDYIYRLGFLTKKDLADDVKITEADKEDFLNKILGDCYKWVCIIIHFILTLIIVWNYINYFLFYYFFLCCCLLLE